MKEPLVSVHLDNNRRHYFPGDILAGYYRFDSRSGPRVKAVEIAVLWQTEGKGETDLSVHEFFRMDFEAGDLVDFSSPQRFTTTLPHSPLSYDGQLVKIRWCVRIRVFREKANELTGEKIFFLGAVPPLDDWGSDEEEKKK